MDFQDIGAGLMSGSVRFDNSRLQSIERELQKLAASHVLVGIQEGTVTKAQDMPVSPQRTGPNSQNVRHKEGGQSMAYIGAVNEFGLEGIPARPFIGPAIDNNRSLIIRMMESEFDNIITGKSHADKVYTVLGKEVTELIHQQILDVHWPPLSQSWVDEKGSSKPLIDFGQMYDSINYRIVP